MPDALAIMSVCAIIIAAIFKRPSSIPLRIDPAPAITSISCTACKAELTRRIDERSEETGSIFRELKKQGEQLARIETRLDGMAPVKKAAP
jgi:hypothetical protein